jgi:hypothetical protein
MRVRQHPVVVASRPVGETLAKVVEIDKGQGGALRSVRSRPKQQIRYPTLTLHALAQSPALLKTRCGDVDWMISPSWTTLCSE